jgi:hypothetical protein
VTKLLIDECLSSELALMARERGHHETSRNVSRGMDRQVGLEGLGTEAATAGQGLGAGDQKQ